VQSTLTSIFDAKILYHLSLFIWGWDCFERVKLVASGILQVLRYGTETRNHMCLIDKSQELLHVEVIYILRIMCRRECVFHSMDARQHCECTEGIASCCFILLIFVFHCTIANCDVARLLLRYHIFIIVVINLSCHSEALIIGVLAGSGS